MDELYCSAFYDLDELHIMNKTKGEPFTILGIKEDGLVLSSGHTIMTEHVQDCCEYVYADWSVLEMTPWVFTKKLTVLVIKPVDDGLLLCLYPNMINTINETVFVPCYSEQNGYYSDALSLALKLDGEIIEEWCLPDKSVRKCYD